MINPQNAIGPNESPEQSICNAFYLIFGKMHFKLVRVTPRRISMYFRSLTNYFSIVVFIQFLWDFVTITTTIIVLRILMEIRFFVAPRKIISIVERSIFISLKVEVSFYLFSILEKSAGPSVCGCDIFSSERINIYLGVRLCVCFWHSHKLKGVYIKSMSTRVYLLAYRNICLLDFHFSFCLFSLSPWYLLLTPHFRQRDHFAGKF